MTEVTEVVIALLMLVNGEMKEARIQTGYAECIKGARIAKRGLKINSSVKYSCIKCEAILEDNIDGSKSITAIDICNFSKISASKKPCCSIIIRKRKRF